MVVLNSGDYYEMVCEKEWNRFHFNLNKDTRTEIWRAFWVWVTSWNSNKPKHIHKHITNLLPHLKSRRLIIMKENQFQKKIVDLLKSKGCWIHNVHGHKMQRRGVPDLLVIGLYWTGFLELKVGNAKCSDIQRAVITDIKRRKFPVYVLRYDEKYDAIQIEDQHGTLLNLVAWDALYGWLKNPIGPISVDGIKTVM